MKKIISLASVLLFLSNQILFAEPIQLVPVETLLKTIPAAASPTQQIDIRPAPAPFVTTLTPALDTPLSRVEVRKPTASGIQGINGFNLSRLESWSIDASQNLVFQDGNAYLIDQKTGKTQKVKIKNDGSIIYQSSDPITIGAQSPVISFSKGGSLSLKNGVLAIEGKEIVIKGDLDFGTTKKVVLNGNIVLSDALTLRASSGSISFKGSILGPYDLTVQAKQATFGSAVTVNNISVDASTIYLASNMTTQIYVWPREGNISLNGNVILTGDVILNATASIKVTGTVDSATGKESLSAYNWSTRDPRGINISFLSDIGQKSPLKNVYFSVDQRGKLSLRNVTTTGSQTYGASSSYFDWESQGRIFLSGNLKSTGGDIHLSGIVELQNPAISIQAAKNVKLLGEGNGWDGSFNGGMMSGSTHLTVVAGETLHISGDHEGNTYQFDVQELQLRAKKIKLDFVNMKSASDINLRAEDISFGGELGYGSVTSFNAGRNIFLKGNLQPEDGVPIHFESLGHGNLRVDGEIQGLGVLSLKNLKDASFLGNVEAASITEEGGTGFTRFAKNLRTSSYPDLNTGIPHSGIRLSGNNFVFNDILALYDRIIIQYTGSVTFRGTVQPPPTLIHAETLTAPDGRVISGRVVQLPNSNTKEYYSSDGKLLAVDRGTGDLGVIVLDYNSDGKFKSITEYGVLLDDHELVRKFEFEYAINRAIWTDTWLATGTLFEQNSVTGISWPFPIFSYSNITVTVDQQGRLVRTVQG